MKQKKKEEDWRDAQRRTAAIDSSRAASILGLFKVVTLNRIQVPGAWVGEKRPPGAIRNPRSSIACARLIESMPVSTH